MITVSFDLFNEGEYVSSHEKTFDSENERHRWFRAQIGHPYLSYSNEKIIDNKDAGEENET